MPVAVVRRLFTVEEYYEMAHSGILSEEDRVELLAGEIVEMSPIGSRHAACIKYLNQVFSKLLGDLAVVSVQDPVRLTPYSEPEPDLALLRPREDFYAQAHPKPQDVFLVIEVSETSVETDREVKLPLYAEAGIPEVWIFDLEARCVEVYRKPFERAYSVIERCSPKQQLSPQAFPQVKVDLEDILGKLG
ncbi:MAG: Uma2 family endonuclease [bacterium]